MTLLRWINAQLEGVANALSRGPPLRTFLGICAASVAIHLIIHLLH